MYMFFRLIFEALDSKNVQVVASTVTYPAELDSFLTGCMKSPSVAVRLMAEEPHPLITQQPLATLVVDVTEKQLVDVTADEEKVNVGHPATIDEEYVAVHTPVVASLDIEEFALPTPIVVDMMLDDEHSAFHSPVVASLDTIIEDVAVHTPLVADVKLDEEHFVFHTPVVADLKLDEELDSALLGLEKLDLLSKETFIPLDAVNSKEEMKQAYQGDEKENMRGYKKERRNRENGKEKEWVNSSFGDRAVLKPPTWEKICSVNPSATESDPWEEQPDSGNIQNFSELTLSHGSEKGLYLLCKQIQLTLKFSVLGTKRRFPEDDPIPSTRGSVLKTQHSSVSHSPPRYVADYSRRGGYNELDSRGRRHFRGGFDNRGGFYNASDSGRGGSSRGGYRDNSNFDSPNRGRFGDSTRGNRHTEGYNGNRSGAFRGARNGSSNDLPGTQFFRNPEMRSNTNAFPPRRQAPVC